MVCLKHRACLFCQQKSAFYQSRLDFFCAIFRWLFFSSQCTQQYKNINIYIYTYTQSGPKKTPPKATRVGEKFPAKTCICLRVFWKIRISQIYGAVLSLVNHIMLSIDSIFHPDSSFLNHMILYFFAYLNLIYHLLTLQLFNIWPWFVLI